MKLGGPLAFISETFKMQPCVGGSKLFKGFTTWELLNINSADILDIPERLYSQYHVSPVYLQSVMEAFGIQSISKDVLEKEFDIGSMRYFLSNSRHYSWPKAGGKYRFVKYSLSLIFISSGHRYRRRQRHWRGTRPRSSC